jgi:hypothetical protein
LNISSFKEIILEVERERQVISTVFLSGVVVLTNLKGLLNLDHNCNNNHDIKMLLRYSSMRKLDKIPFMLTAKLIGRIRNHYKLQLAILSTVDRKVNFRPYDDKCQFIWIK